MKVSMTGPATDEKGMRVVRVVLEKAMNAAGYTMVDYPYPADILVASRTDTRKYKKAVKDGLQVFTYPDFISFLRTKGVNVEDYVEEPVHENMFTDKTPWEKAGTTEEQYKELAASEVL